MLLGQLLTLDLQHGWPKCSLKGKLITCEWFLHSGMWSQSEDLMANWRTKRDKETRMSPHIQTHCSLSIHPSILEMNVAMANIAQAETKPSVTSITSSAMDRRWTLSPPTTSRSTTPPCTRSTTPPRVTDPELSQRSNLERLRASPGANLLAGGVGGLASLVVGHPFDTVKVKIIWWGRIYILWHHNNLCQKAFLELTF